MKIKWQYIIRSLILVLISIGNPPNIMLWSSFLWSVACFSVYTWISAIDICSTTYLCNFMRWHVIRYFCSKFSILWVLRAGHVQSRMVRDPLWDRANISKKDIINFWRLFIPCPSLICIFLLHMPFMYLTKQILSVRNYHNK